MDNKSQNQNKNKISCMGYLASCGFVGALIIGYPILLIKKKFFTENKLSVKSCLSYMKNKYNMEFTSFENGKDSKVSYFTSSMLETYVNCPKYPKEKIFVVQERLEKGKKVLFHDNYVAVKYKKKTIELSEKIAKSVFDECKVIYEADPKRVLSDDFDDNTTFEEFISLRSSNICFDIMVPFEHSIEEREKELKKLEDLCIENHFVCVCNVYYCSSEEAYNSVNCNNDLIEIMYGTKSYKETGNIQKGYKINGQFDIKSDFTVNHEIWRKN